MFSSTLTHHPPPTTIQTQTCHQVNFDEDEDEDDDDNDDDDDGEDEDEDDDVQT